MKILYTLVIGAFVMLVGVGAYFFMYGGTKTQMDVSSEEPANAPIKAVVVYTDTGFSPQTVTISNGGEVEFINRSSMPLWVASNPHPEHTDYPEFDTPKILGNRMPEMKENVRFRFAKSGSWGFHNHTASGDTTKITVHPGTVIVK